MLNQIQIEHQYFSQPDEITVNLNGRGIYTGPADVGKLDFVPDQGTNVLNVILDHKQPGNFFYDDACRQVTKNSVTKIKEIIVEGRYFRSLLTKCGLVEIDIARNPDFPSKYIDHENCLTMAGSIYLIKFDFPIKQWMQIHLHGRDLSKHCAANQRARSLLENYQQVEI